MLHDAKQIARCTDNAHDAVAMHVARAISACFGHRRRGSWLHRQLKARLAHRKWECILL